MGRMADFFVPMRGETFITVQQADPGCVRQKDHCSVGTIPSVANFFGSMKGAGVLFWGGVWQENRARG